jgi:ATP-dependent DNA helicase RecG
MNTLSNLGIFNDNQLGVLAKKSIRNIQDLLFYLPRKYIDRSAQLDFRTSRAGDEVTFIGQVSGSEVKYGRRRRLIVYCLFDNFKVELVFFQAIPYYQKLFQRNTTAAFWGKIEIFRGKVSMLHPEVELLSGDELTHTGKIIPVYKITESMRKCQLTSRSLRSAISAVLKTGSFVISDPFFDEYPKQEEFLPLLQALEYIHFPSTMDDVEKARLRLAFDELILFSVFMYEKKQQRKLLKKSFLPSKNQNKTWPDILIKSLPFKLTPDQVNAIDRIRKLVYESSPYGVLLQGDVGSGKTLVCLFAALEYLEDGIQVAIMAPTEILAKQHYLNFINYLSVLPFLQMELLTGSEKASEKKAKLDRIKRGDTLLVVGTHALIQEAVEFSSLGLVVIDEQHRFGVEQRDALRSKGVSPDLLTMSATPIPRSLTLSLYGDLEPVILKEKPPGRKPVDTRLFDEAELPGLYRGIKKYVDQGRQAYIVYPLIDESEKTSWASVMADYQQLEKDVFKDYRLGLLHGRLASDEKDRAMQKFKQGLIQILVTTTVIEVGVDVPNATVMMIRNAEKFGLSQLHQLRGRVGRGGHQSFCILVKSVRSTDDAEKRLHCMVESEDGFYLAQKDFEIRGSGELLSTRQSGVSEFKIADLRIHTDIAALAFDMIESNETLRNKILSTKNWKSLLKKGYILFES